MSREESCLLWVAIGLYFLAAVLLALFAARTEGAETDDLWAAVCWKESRGNAQAVGDGGLAVGIAQIHPICVADTNRICRLLGLADRFTLADRLSPKRSRRIFDIYTSFYALRWRLRSGRGEAPLSILARIWNGGPDGPEDAAALAYWHRVRGHLAAIRKAKKPLTPVVPAHREGLVKRRP